MLWRKTIIVNVSSIEVHLPHPSDYVMQKLITLSKRKEKYKSEKDRESAKLLLEALMEKSEVNEIEKSFLNL